MTPDRRNGMEVPARLVGRWLLIVVGGFTVAGIGSAVLRSTGRTNVRGLVPMFDLGAEANAPTLFSTLLFICIGALCFLLARLDPSRRRWWSAAALVACFVALDEAVQIHEATTNGAREIVGDVSWLFFAWVVPYSLAAALLAFAFLPFLRGIRMETARRLVFAAGLFVFAAVLLEMLEGHLIVTRGLVGSTEFDGGIATVVIGQESLEMLAAVITIHALLRHLSADRHAIGLQFVD